MVYIVKIVSGNPIIFNADADSEFKTSTGDLILESTVGSLIINAGEAVPNAIRLLTFNEAGGIDIDVGRVTLDGIVPAVQGTSSFDILTVTGAAGAFRDSTADPGGAGGGIILTGGAGGEIATGGTGIAGTGADLTFTAGAGGNAVVAATRGTGGNITFTAGATGIGAGGGGANGIIDMVSQVQIQFGSPGLNKILRSDATGLATWIDPGSGGLGDVIGPGASTDHAIVRWDGVTGTLIQDSGVIINDANQMSLIYTAVEDTDFAVKISCDATGFADVKALDVFYDSGAITSVDAGATMLCNIDESASTGGRIFGQAILSTSQGSATVYGLGAGTNVNPIFQQAGTTEDADLILDNAVDVTATLSVLAGTVTVFEANSETFTVGNAVQFAEIEFLVPTPAGGGGIQPTFGYSTGTGPLAYTAFSPIDGTNGFRNSGNISWDISDIPGWITDAGNYKILITRNRVSIPTDPIFSLVQIATTIEYSWDSVGTLCIQDITLKQDPDNSTWYGYNAGHASTSAQNAAFGESALAGIAGGDNNSAFGYFALDSLTTGGQNVAVGSSSSGLIDSESNTVAVGYMALNANTAAQITGVGSGVLAVNTGTGNSGFGYNALTANTTGTGITAVGFEALLTCTTGGSQSTAIGYRALRLATGVRNTAVGYNAGTAISGGIDNVFLGTNAGDTITTTGQNVAIGSGSFGGSGASNCVAIGYNTMTSSSHSGAQNVAIGSFAMEDATTATQCVAIGYNSLKDNAVSNSNTAVGYSTMAVATGATDCTVIGNSAGAALTSGDFNTLIGSLAGDALTTGSFNTCIGYSAGDGMIASNNNIIIGYLAGERISSLLSRDNVLVGNNALKESNTGDSGQNVCVGISTCRTYTGDLSECVAVGFEALNANESDGVTAVGYRAMTDNTSGVNNTAIGHSAMLLATTADSTVAIGDTALGGAILTGNANTSVGMGAGLAVTSGANNTIVGEGAGDVFTTGSNNILIGKDAGSVHTVADSDNINIGHVGVIESDAIRIGTDGTHATCFIQGIHSVSPSSTENVIIDTNGQLGSTAGLSGFNLTATGTVDFNTVSSFDLVATDASATAVQISASNTAGGVVIGAGDTGAVNLNNGILLTSSTGTITTTGVTSAIPIVDMIVEITTTTAVDLATLANGTDGQVLKLLYAAEGATADELTVTPATFASGDSITFTDVGSAIELQYNDVGGWYYTGGSDNIVNGSAGGSLDGYDYVLVSATPFAPDINDNFIEVDTVAIAAPITINLPAISTVGKKQYIITDATGIAGTHNITINRGGADTISGGTSVTITAAYNTINLISNGISRWSQF